MRNINISKNTAQKIVTDSVTGIPYAADFNSLTILLTLKVKGSKNNHFVNLQTASKRNEFKYVPSIDLLINSHIKT